MFRALLSLILLSSLASVVRAEELLEGPYPFRRDNELSIHGGYAAGIGDTFGGPKAVVDYGYHLQRGWWLDLDAGWLSGLCDGHSDAPACQHTGSSVEVLAGVKWKLRMNVPLVPYAKLLTGIAFQFPDGARSAAGPLARAGVGATYFFYEWLGVGAEVTGAVGRAGYATGSTLSRGLGALDVTLGAELPF